MSSRVVTREPCPTGRSRVRRLLVCIGFVLGAAGCVDDAGRLRDSRDAGGPTDGASNPTDASVIDGGPSADAGSLGLRMASLTDCENYGLTDDGRLAMRLGVPGGDVILSDARYRAASYNGGVAVFVRDDGAVECLRDHPFCPRPASGEVVVEAVVGTRWGCVLYASGEVHCQPGDERRAGPYDSIHGGFGLAARRPDGLVDWWEPAGGGNEFERPPADVRFKEISLKHGLGCGLRPDGSMVCWGKWGIAAVPVDEQPLPGRFRTVSVCAHWICGVREGGGIQCSQGPFPDARSWSLPGRFVDIAAPTTIGPPSTLCAIDEQRALRCFVH